MGSLAFVTGQIQCVLRSPPGRLALYVLEKTAQLAADGFDAIVGQATEETSATAPVKKTENDNKSSEDSDLKTAPGTEKVVGKSAELKTKSGTATDETFSPTVKGHLVHAARVSAKFFRRLQKWLRSLYDEVPPSSDAPSPAIEGRRRLVAWKQSDRLGPLTRVFRCALYALTDTLDDIGVKVELLEYAKGTLHVSGDKSIDCSPVKERSGASPSKRKDFEDSEDEEEDLCTLEQLERSYDSQEDEDYQPPSDEGVSTDSEEYKEGQTESDQSEHGYGDEDAAGDELPARRKTQPPAGGRTIEHPTRSTAGPSTKTSTIPQAESTIGPPAKITNRVPAKPTEAPSKSTVMPPVQNTSGRSADSTTKSPAGSTKGPVGADIKAKLGQKDAGKPDSVTKIDPAKKKMPGSDRTP